MFTGHARRFPGTIPPAIPICPMISERRPRPAPRPGRTVGLLDLSSPLQKGSDVAPERAGLLAFVRGQLVQRARLAQPRQVVVGLPVPQPLQDLHVGLPVSIVERPAPPGEVLPEPVDRLPAPTCALLVVRLFR